MEPWTRTGRAISDDDELYRLLNPTGTSKRQKRRRPEMAEWGWHEELLATLPSTRRAAGRRPASSRRCGPAVRLSAPS